MKHKLVFIIFTMLLLISSICFFIQPKVNDKKMKDLSGYSISQIEDYASENNLNLIVNTEYNDNIDKDFLIDQSIVDGDIIKPGDNLTVTISKGKLDIDKLKELNVNELGRIPVMMYHGIQNVPDGSTGYIGGNIDKDGYQRTSDAFRRDLEFYYKNNYRMIRLEDYINGKIDVEIGKSPLVLTFDDGLSNSIKVTGLDKDGNIIIDPNSAVGILEEYKAKYPDFNVTATFFVNGGLFNQPLYNDKILDYLISHGYDIGNHSYTHANFTKLTPEQSEEEIGKLYNLLDKYISGKYLNIVALPYGTPYTEDNPNFSHIITATYNGIKYETEATLRVGWESDYSPFSNEFNKQFIKRIRAYDNNGKDFDIEMNFKLLENNRYISDGDYKTITVKSNDKDKVKDSYGYSIITY